jgi:hypothetical protein
MINTIIIIIFLFIFILLVVVKYINIKNLNELNTISNDTLCNKCKTGDLFLYRKKNVDLFHDLFSKYTHIGMIVELNNEKYVFENHIKDVHIGKGFETEGIHLFKLIDRINTYDGTMYYASLKHDINQDVLNNFIYNIENLQNIEFEYDKIRLVYSCLSNRIFKNCSVISDKKICSEFVMFCLTQLQVLNNECNCIFPGDFHNLKVNDKFIFDTFERIDKNKISYKEVYNTVHYFITFLIIFGGLIGLLFNNLNIVKIHILFNIIILVHWLTNNNRCFISDLTYGDNESNTKYSEELFTSLFNYKLNDVQQNIVAYLTIIIPTIISMIIVNTM